MNRLFWKKIIDGFRGAGHAAITIPSMDGALLPNEFLEQGEPVFEIEKISCLCRAGGKVLFAAGREIYALNSLDTDPSVLSLEDNEITALATGPNDVLAIGLAGQGVVVRRPSQTEIVVGPDLSCPTAILFENASTLIVCNGSSSNEPSHWQRDFLERNAAGSVWRINFDTGESKCLAENLAYPAGVALSQDGGIVVAESWNAHLISIQPDGTVQTVLEDLPGYPGAICPSENGGFWLSVFAPRRQMIEFVLREETFRKRMMKTLPEELWMAPALSSGNNYLEPVQSGSVRQLGKLKPWAPTRSYGLLVALDGEFGLHKSFHSRADGRRHGITSAVDFGGYVLATSTGAGLLLAVDPDLAED